MADVLSRILDQNRQDIRQDLRHYDPDRVRCLWAHFCAVLGFLSRDAAKLASLEYYKVVDTDVVWIGLL